MLESYADFVNVEHLGGDEVHQFFLDWIISQKEAWKGFNIKIDKVIDKIVHIENPDFPYVAVHHIDNADSTNVEIHNAKGCYHE